MNKFLNNKFLKSFLKLYIPVIFILGLLFLLFYQYDKNIYQEELKSSESEFVNHMSSNISSLVSQYIVDTQILNEIIHNYYSSFDEETHKQLKTYLTSYIKEEITVERLRIADQNGNEMFKLDYNKGNPKYSAGFRKLPEGYIKNIQYLDSSDVNTYITEIEYKVYPDNEILPIFKCFSKMRDTSGNINGYIILEVKATNLFNFYTLRKNEVSSRKIVNTKGITKLDFSKQIRSTNDYSTLNKDPIEFISDIDFTETNDTLIQKYQNGLHSIRVFDKNRLLNSLTDSTITFDIQSPFIVYSYVDNKHILSYTSRVLHWYYLAVIILIALVLFFVLLSREKKTLIEEELKESEDLVFSISNSLTDALVVVDSKSIIRYWSESGKRIFGYEFKEIIGEELHNIIAKKEDKEKAAEGFKSFEETGEGPMIGHLKEVTAVRKSGEEFPAELSINAFRRHNEWWAVGVIRDITERKEQEKVLYESESRFKSVFNQTNLGIALLNLDSKIIDLNDSFAELFDFNKNELISYKFFNLVHKDEQKECSTSFNKLKKGDQDNLFLEKKCVNRSGNEFWTQMNCSLVRDINNKPKYIIAILQDISIRKRVEDKLVKRERQISTLLGNLPGLVYRCLFDNKYTMLFASEGCETLTGYSKEEIQEGVVEYEELIHIEDKNMVWDQIKKAGNENKAYTLNYRIHTKSGQIKWVWEQGVKVGTNEEGVDILEGFITDITERKNIELQLIESEDKYKDLANSINDAFFAINRNKEIIFFNKTLEKITDVKEEEILGRRMFTTIPELKSEKIEEAVDKVFETKETEIVYDVLKFRGHEYHLEFSVSYSQTGVTILGRDITENVKARKKIEDSELKFRDLANSIGMTFFALDKNKRYTFYNKTLQNITGRTEEQMLGNKLFDSAPEMRGNKLEKTIDEVLKNNKTEIINEILKFDGKSYHVEFSISPSQSGVTVLGRDITENVKAQEKLEESERKFRELAASINDVFIVIDDDFNITYWNKTAEEYYGLKGEQVVKRSMFNVFPNLKTEEILKYFKLAKKEDETQSFIHNSIYINKIFDVRIYPSTNGFTLLLNDISQLDKYKNLFETTKGKFENLTESINDIFIALDDDLKITFWNQKASDTFDVSANTAVGKKINEIFPDSILKPLLDVYQESVKKKTTSRKTLELELNGETKYFDINIYPTKEGTSILAKDDTERIEKEHQIEELNEELKKSYSELQKLDDAKSYFLGLLSHELNTPLMGIKGNTEVIKKFTDDKDLIEIADEILLSEQKLRNFAESALLITKLQTDLINLSEEPVTIKMLFEDALSKIDNELERKSINLALDLNNSEAKIRVDSNLMSRVIEIILSNAVKYSFEENKIEIHGNKVNGIYELSVRDYGPGFDPDIIHDIFKAFISDKLMHHTEGYGLSLTAAKIIVDMHNGEIKAENMPDKGAKVTLRLHTSEG